MKARSEVWEDCRNGGARISIRASGEKTLTMSVSAPTPLRTARVKSALSRSTLKSCGEAMNTMFVVKVAAETGRTTLPMALDVASAEAGRTELPLTVCGFDMLGAKRLSGKMA